MNKKKIITIIASVVLTAVAVGGIYFGFKQISKPEQTVEVAVATQDIKAGEICSSKNYTYVEMAKSKVSPSYVTKVEVENQKGNDKTYTVSDVLKGKEASSAIYQNEPIMKGRITGLNSTVDATEIIDYSKYTKMMYNVTDTKSLDGQVHAGDKVDLWVRYTLTDKTTHDKLVVVDKILKKVLVNRTFDSDGKEITDITIPAKSMEILLAEDEVSEYLKYQDFGRYTLVKSPSSDDKESDEVVRKKLSTNGLIQEIISMKEDQVTADKIYKDPAKANEVQNYELDASSK